ncbi:unnamed protein product [Didymodactylos carnosus]|uniref:Uncharacterized protein n=1 Tax=Didymodactylos carnosus TaxID=1234261 RepID=A0A814D5K9_9BILA|nr:unnamed protein product [Didymodactylos carnosus]CAF1420670.1 unnamed protein product [Didymodactylos carnosus]CAF3725514.1 unnamed protein product [Didymodactylos carnosus]CAF4221352.1 unnamed protein product [Didymodactylos carnosus]
MTNCLRLAILFIPAFITLGLLAVAFATNWWTIVLEQNIPKNINIKNSNLRLYQTLLRIPQSRGLFSECISYRLVNLTINDSYNFLPEPSKEELAIADRNCSIDQFMCATGYAISNPLTRCIQNQQQCNGIIDCVDKSDETSTVCNERLPLRCQDGYEKCPDQKMCYRVNDQTCDGVSNCLDDSDEQNCSPQRCEDNKRAFCIKERKCARREHSHSCDGISDCADNSDEENCPSHECRGDTISCDNRCYRSKYRCDGTVQCSDFSDEKNCVEYTTKNYLKVYTIRDDRKCIEKRFTYFGGSPTIDNNIDYNNNNNNNEYQQKRVEYLTLTYYLRMGIFFGIIGGLLFTLLSILSLFLLACCRKNCHNVPFILYGIWTFLAFLSIIGSLGIYVYLWLWEKQTVVDIEKNLPFDVMIHENNTTIRNIEFFGLSFWLACGAILSTFLSLLCSYRVCCKLQSSRAEDKEYEIMQMQMQAY